MHSERPKLYGVLAILSAIELNPRNIDYLELQSELQIRGSIEDNLIIFLFLNKNISCDPSLEPSQRDGSNVGSQNMFLWRIIANYPKIIPVTPSYLEHCPIVISLRSS